MAPSRKFLAFDIETATDVPGDDFPWRLYRPLGIACAATDCEDNVAPKLWHGGPNLSRPAPKMQQKEAAQVVEYLTVMVTMGFTIVTWNGLAFDFDVLAEESGRLDECRILALGHVDMMFHLLCLQGFPIGLDNAARGTGVPGKTAGMTGKDAPQLWMQGKHREVLNYVAQDARTTFRLANVCDQQKSLRWITRKGSPSSCALPTGWLPVKDAMCLPQPDTSWMTNPLSREEMMAWLVE